MTPQRQPFQKSALPAFRPHLLIRNSHIQTVVSSLRKADGPNLVSASEEMILDTGEGIYLQGLYTPQRNSSSKGVVLLLHGWLGGASSNYLIILGEALVQNGYAVFRLNLRDHGGTHHLNPAPFRSDRLDEVYTAVRQIAQLEPDLPLHIVGASLGGNFALRLAWRHAQTPLANLGTVIAICPAINPHQTTLVLDKSHIYRTYFRRKWRKAFAKKKAAFPRLYDFSEEVAASTCMEMTEVFVRNHSPYSDASAYFKEYTVTPEMMAILQTPTIILAAADDPIIPATDFNPFHDVSPWLRVLMQPYGGHVGFIDIFPYRHWLDSAVLSILADYSL